jgi:dUTPase
MNVLSFSHTGGAESNADPRRATPGAAGLDLTLPKTSVIPPRGTVWLDHRITLRFPPGVFGFLALRSSSARLGISLAGGIVG